MKLKKIFKKKKVNLYIFILAVIFLAIIPLLRFFFYNSIIIGQESYYHLRIAGQITESGIPSYDLLGNSNYILNPLHLLLAPFIYIIGEKATSIFFPFMLGLLSIVIFIKILEKWNFDSVKKFFISFVLIASPIFIYTFSTINSFSLSVFLILLGFYFFIKDEKSYFIFPKKENKINFYLSLLIFILVSFFGLFNLLIILVILLAYSSFKKNKLKNFYLIAFVLLLISLIYSPSSLYPFIFPKKFILTMSALTTVIFELGAIPGFRVVTLLLAVLGFFKLWSEENKRTFLIIFLLLFISSFFITNIIFYLNFIIAIPAAYGLLMLFKMRWKVKLIKKLTLVILITSLLLSSFSSIGVVSSFPPNKSTINSLKWLKSHSIENETVLSYFTNSFWIQKIADRPTLIDPTLKNNPIYTNLFDSSDQIFYSRNLEKTTFLLRNNNITYIWIDQKMKDGQVWIKLDQGLLFLLTNSETFKKIYNRDNIEIWKFDSNKE